MSNSKNNDEPLKNGGWSPEKNPGGSKFSASAETELLYGDGNGSDRRLVIDDEEEDALLEVGKSRINASPSKNGSSDKLHQSPAKNPETNADDDDDLILIDEVSHNDEDDDEIQVQREIITINEEELEDEGPENENTDQQEVITINDEEPEVTKDQGESPAQSPIKNHSLEANSTRVQNQEVLSDNASNQVDSISANDESHPEPQDLSNRGLCQKCNERKIFRYNLCYRCRGASGQFKNSNRSEKWKQSDDEFVSKCLEVRGKRRVSNKPLTFTEEFLLSPKRTRPQDPKPTRQSLPNMRTRSSAATTTLNTTIKQEPLDDSLPDPLNDALPDLIDVKQEPGEGQQQLIGTRIRQCVQCKETKMHHARGLCRACYNKWNTEQRMARSKKTARRSLPVRFAPIPTVKVEDKNESQPIINILTSNAHARRCEGCSQMKRHYARNRCQQCYQRFVSYCRRNGLVIRDQPIPKDLTTTTVKQEEEGGCKNCGKPVYSMDLCRTCFNTDLDTQPELDFSNHRVCQECKEYKVHHCRGMCRTCYEQDLKAKCVGTTLAAPTMVEKRRTVIPVVRDLSPEVAQPLRASTSFQLLSHSTTALASKKSKWSATNCVVCHVALDEQTLWPGSIVCRQCHADKKHRHRWCVNCNQLRVHDGGGKCRPCNLAAKGLNPNIKSPGKLALHQPKTVSASHWNDRQRVVVNKNFSTTLNQSPSLDLQSQLHSISSSSPLTHCVVCQTQLDLNKVTRNAKICEQCRDRGMQRMRWCLDCKLLKLHQGRSRCRECYHQYMKGAGGLVQGAIKQENVEEEEISGMTEEEYEDEESQEMAGTSAEGNSSQTNTLLKQIQALCNQWNNKVDTIQQPIRATNTAPARHSLPATRVANSKLIKSHQEHLRLMDQNTQDQTCLVCHTPIDFRRQSKNSKICLTCRDKGLSRMRWCIDCNQLKHQQGRGRCQECYRVHMGMAVNPNAVASLGRLGLETAPLTNSTDAEKTLLDQLNAIFSQFSANSTNVEPQSGPSTSRLSLPQQRQRHPPQPKFNTAILSKSMHQIKVEQPAANCVVCREPIDFTRQAKNTKICLDCHTKKLHKHRWCADCNQLKLCIGRGRCSPCYTIHMRELKAQQAPSIKVKTSPSKLASTSYTLNMTGSPQKTTNPSIMAMLQGVNKEASGLVLNVDSNLNLNFNRGLTIDRPSTSRQLNQPSTSSSSLTNNQGQKLAAALNRLAQHAQSGGQSTLSAPIRQTTSTSTMPTIPSTNQVQQNQQSRSLAQTLHRLNNPVDYVTLSSDEEN